MRIATIAVKDLFHDLVTITKHTHKEVKMLNMGKGKYFYVYEARPFKTQDLAFSIGAYSVIQFFDEENDVLLESIAFKNKDEAIEYLKSMNYEQLKPLLN